MDNENMENMEYIEQGWQRLQIRIEELFGKYLREDFQEVGYAPPKSHFPIEMPSEHG